MSVVPVWRNSDWFLKHRKIELQATYLNSWSLYMAHSRKSLRKLRSAAFAAQHGRCYYCNQPMWTDDPHSLISDYKISRQQARLLQCTGEHLVAHADGGSSERENIVAACRFCNTRRHKGNAARSPSVYESRVRQRMKQGKWHGLLLNC